MTQSMVFGTFRANFKGFVFAVEVTACYPLIDIDISEPHDGSIGVVASTYCDGAILYAETQCKNTLDDIELASDAMSDIVATMAMNKAVEQMQNAFGTKVLGLDAPIEEMCF